MKNFSEDKFESFKYKRALAIALVALYVVGLVLMLCNLFSQGLALWFISTAGGALTLYVKRRQAKKVADLAREEAEEREYQARLRAQAADAGKQTDVASDSQSQTSVAYDSNKPTSVDNQEKN